MSLRKKDDWDEGLAEYGRNRQNPPVEAVIYESVAEYAKTYTFKLSDIGDDKNDCDNRH